MDTAPEAMRSDAQFVLLEDGNADKETLGNVLEDDEDSFIYGDSIKPIELPAASSRSPPVNDVANVLPVPEAVTYEQQSNGVVAHLEAEAETEETEETEDAAAPEQNQEDDAEGTENEEQGTERDDGDDSEEDIEFILEPPTRSLDFRGSQRGPPRPGQPRTPSVAPQGTPAPITNLTTEYTPRERGTPVDVLKRAAQSGTDVLPSTPTPTSTAGTAVQPTAAQQPPDDGVDTSTLPPARAPPSHPAIDPSVPGMHEGRSIFEVDMTNLAEKPWRRPGSDLSDWFNYGFDEISWEAYCYQRRSLGDMAGVLKANVLGFAGMQEEQLLALPADARTMVMTGTNAMLNSGGPNGPGVGVPGNMMPPVGMNPMGGMNPMMAAEMGGMSGMGPMGVGMGAPMGMGMNGDMGVPMPGGVPGAPMMQEGGQGGPVHMPMQGANGTPEPVAQMMPDGMSGAPGPGMMGMHMGGDFGGMQDANPMQAQQVPHGMNQQVFMDNPAGAGTGGGTPSPLPMRNVPPTAPSQLRGRGGGGGGIGGGVAVGPRAPRGAPQGPAAYAGRGRVVPAPLVRPASPLPPNVPTGPRNPGPRYKDRDNNAPAVEGLDYGGGGGAKEGSGTPVEREREREREDEKPSARKRRSPPTTEDGDRMSRSSKRR